MDKSVTTGRAARLLAVLAVLLGLLAMHGVAGAHHAAAETPAADHAAATVSEQPPAETAHLHDRPAGQHETAVRLVTAGQHAAAAPREPAGPLCHGDCRSVAALCLAVLVGAAVALLLARRRASPPLFAPSRRRATAPAPSVRHVRGPDPVRELCVSRT